MQKVITMLLIVGLVSGPTFAGPTGPKVVRGSAEFSQVGNELTVTTSSNKTIINWGSFSIDAGSTVNFVQPNAGSSVMNRVTGSQRSSINGLMMSNGSIYLINRNGILIGQLGRIHAASFVASTLPVTNTEFMTGADMVFKGDSNAYIDNRGEIKAIGGNIYLISARVSNSGKLVAAKGSVNLLAGREILLTQDHDIFIRPVASGDKSGIGVNNSGVIEAFTIRLQADGNMYALAINSTGTIRATGFQNIDGRIVLSAKAGSVINMGTLVAKTVNTNGTTTGGEININGNTIVIGANAKVDASGDLAGGKVNIISKSYNFGASTTGIEAGASVSANALTTGDGGQIMIMADMVDGTTTVRGNVSANGAGNGNGGFIETSAATVAFGGAQVMAGNGGTWLIDPPVNLTIDAAGALAIVTALNLGTNTHITTLPGGGAITVASPIVAANTGEAILLLEASDHILIDADINVGPGSLWLWAGNGVSQAKDTTVTAGKLGLRGVGTFTLDNATNDFGMLGFAVHGDTTIVDANDLRIGNVGSSHGVSAWGHDVDIHTPNGHLLATGLFPQKAVKRYSSRGDVDIIETQWDYETYQIRVTNGFDNGAPAVSPSAVASFLGVNTSEITNLSTGTENGEGSAVRIEFDPTLAGELVGYTWQFKTREAYDSGTAANDYSFVRIAPTATSGSAAPQLLSDVEAAGTSGTQDNGLYSWKTGVANSEHILNRQDPYTLDFGVMDVDHTDYASALFVSAVYYQSHDIPQSSSFIYERIFDHVEDFAHLRPDTRATYVDDSMLSPMLDGMSTYFDRATQRTDQTYYFMSVGSIYQIPR